MSAPRLALVALTAALVTCDGQVSRPPVTRAEPPPVRAPTAVRLDPAIVRTPEDGPVGKARAAFERGELEPALAMAREGLEGVRRACAGGPSCDERSMSRLEWIAARAAYALNRTEECARFLGSLGGRDHPLAAWARLERASLLERQAPLESLALLDTLPTGFPSQERAEAIRARALLEASVADPALRERAYGALRRIVAQAPDHAPAAAAAMPLGRALLASTDAIEREEALALFRRVMTRAPRSSIASEAEALAEEALASLPPARRRELSSLPVSDQRARADALYRAMQHEDAESAFRDLASKLPPKSSEQCDARLHEGKAMLRQKERDLGAKHMESVVADCGGADVRAWARYHAGRAHSMRGRYDEAIAHYDAVEIEAPGHRLADDALYRSAISAEAKGDFEEMRARLAGVKMRYPEGDMWVDAEFRLAWDARKRGATDRSGLEEALVRFDSMLADGAPEPAEDERGRIAYWKARTLLDLGRTSEAVEVFASVIGTRPLGYYAQQALHRLDEIEPSRAEALRAALLPVSDEPLLFDTRPELEADGFDRALELLRVGSIDYAEAELAALGFTGDAAEPDLVLLAAALLDRAGAHPEASRLLRRRLPGLMEKPPRGRDYHAWRIAYPKAYHPLIETVAAEVSVPAAFVRAVAREESAFNPRAVSVANAYGLIQLIAPTARTYARKIDLPADPASLMDPNINLRIGAKYIAHLFELYPENPAVVPSAYNAGEGASNRWLKERGEQPLDQWIEDIPYDETRRYTRRVLQTYGIYSWLDTQRFPPLTAKLPNAG